ncbi:MAG: GNAT family N-acetyltransferase [Stackebrandtia sp.]
MTAEHSPALMNAMDDSEVTRLTGSHASISPEAARQWAASRGDTDDRLDLAVIDRASGDCVGEVVLNQWDPDNRSCCFRTLLGGDGRGRGFGTEATRLIVGYGFEKLGLHRVWLTVYAFNPRAQRVYEKVGFVREGVERDDLLWDGEWVDGVRMSILEHEWDRHRGFPEAK